MLYLTCMYYNERRVICQVVDGFKKEKKVMMAVLCWKWNTQGQRKRRREMWSKRFLLNLEYFGGNEPENFAFG